MGLAFSKLMFRFMKAREMRVLMLGLDAAGKTSIIFKLKLAQTVTTIPTVGFNVETVTYRNIRFNIWDVGGQDKIRPLWRHYYTGTQALIFVVDSADKERIDEARVELHRIINDREMRDSVLLVFANKQDLPDALTPQQVTQSLDLASIKDHLWNVQGACAIQGNGLVEGLVGYGHGCVTDLQSWLGQNVKQTKEAA